MGVFPHPLFGRKREYIGINRMEVEPMEIKYIPPRAGYWVVAVTADTDVVFESEAAAQAFVADWRGESAVVEYSGSHPEYYSDREIFWRGAGDFMPGRCPGYFGAEWDAVWAWVRAFPAGTEFSEDARTWYPAEAFIEEGM